MARLSENHDRDFSAIDSKSKAEIKRLLADPPARLEDAFDSPAMREHIGQLIVNAIRKSEWN